MNNDHVHHESIVFSDLVLALVFVLFVILYVGAGIISSKYSWLRPWPFHRYVFWIGGVLCAATAIIGPLASRAHTYFTAHMFGHLLLGMLAPLLLVLAAPMTLLLRTLPLSVARSFSRVLRSYPIRMFTHPITAAVLNIGGLWLLYTTDLYMVMQQNIFVHAMVQIHVFVAGYLFTAAIVYIDPIPHRFSFIYRSIVLVIALASHGILSKYIYAHPPHAVPAAQAESGGMLMYYGGDAIDMILICLLCYQWFKATRPRASSSV
ncbi:cytochrome c oxidase assembly protein [Halobacillus amylolyticus]|uniref:Cytochrome c oxidase assembly protein n=1 Tax=Halobacillus amylolyticus TaxID=2932259 RepID=A0ABY4HH90_9BACI|nr:cytochrome c oxidase assembly protein [Halobacillus amylolyticus]UOR13668.1 cytochrome c oxidase assembly protein [Halobacillus amylolyticus]